RSSCFGGRIDRIGAC
nr:Chain L, Natriuretic peptides A [Rattus norvegicus]